MKCVHSQQRAIKDDWKVSVHRQAVTSKTRVEGHCGLWELAYFIGQLSMTFGGRAELVNFFEMKLCL